VSGYVRKSERHDRKLEIGFTHEGTEYQGSSRNISLGGVFIEYDGPTVAYGAKVRLRFNLPSQSEPIQVSGEVRWSEPAKPGEHGGIGVRFEGLRARDVWALNKFLEEPAKEPGA
jgi:uncharacterized protein (TIGR02266 family)